MFEFYITKSKENETTIRFTSCRLFYDKRIFARKFINKKPKQHEIKRGHHH